MLADFELQFIAVAECWSKTPPSLGSPSAPFRLLLCSAGSYV